MKKLLTLGLILGLAACADDGAEDFDEMDTDVELQEPAAAPMPADTMTMDTMMIDTMMTDTMDMDTMGAGM